MKAIHLIKTVSFEGDGRLQKWIKSLNAFNIISEVNIVEDSNIRESAYKFNALIEKNKFLSRRLFPRHKGTLVKIIEYGCKTFSYLIKSKSDIIVFHDVQQYLNILIAIFLNLFTKKRILIWDLHELPHTSLSSNFLSKYYLKYIMSHIDILVYTNIERREYLLKKLGHKEKKFVILNNFPETSFIESKKQPFPDDLEEWLLNQKTNDYILWMGAALKGRNFETVLTVFESIKERVSLVIMGNVDKEFSKRVEELKNENVLFNLYVPQNEVIKYVDNALFSIVLYKSDKPNNMFCEPNRLYQLISRNIPAITGNNPTMKNIIEKYEAGIVLNDDGRDIKSMKNAILKMLDHNQNALYVENMRKIDKLQEFNWDNQFNKLIEIIHYK